MVSTFHGLETGKRALSVGQASIATTGHNIANANTKGYSRQQVNQSTSPSLDVWTNSTNPGQLGSGVSIDSITRVRDRFLDNQHRDQSATLGDAQAKQATFERLETIINEPSDAGLNAVMDQLTNAWQDLENNPDSVSAQAVLKQRAQEFLEVSQAMDSSMTNVKVDLGQQKTAAIDDANRYLEQIAQLNDTIVRGGNGSNDLKDQRDVLIEKLSSLAPIKVEAQANGSYTVNLVQKDGAQVALVTGTTVNKMDDATEVDGGKIGGLQASIEKVEEYQNGDGTNGQVKGLTGITQAFIDANNNSVNGDKLFNADNTVNFNGNITEVPPNLKAETGAVKSDYQELVSVLGAQSQSASRSTANFEATLQATENRRQSVSGVSLDEEMANLVKFQHSYSAAARLISTTDQMLDTIINRMAAR
ncbi:flagellar hook-associated protein FlgK [Planococcus sp. X10-3]|uniref:flagellar hook-associated protein FlgK n=1 Tax=Planococcus sp. X10-3 TaxID=3061240 RepID=UPI003BB17907